MFSRQQGCLKVASYRRSSPRSCEDIKCNFPLYSSVLVHSSSTDDSQIVRILPLVDPACSALVDANIRSPCGCTWHATGTISNFPDKDIDEYNGIVVDERSIFPAREAMMEFLDDAILNFYTLGTVPVYDTQQLLSHDFSPKQPVSCMQYILQSTVFVSGQALKLSMLGPSRGLRVRLYAKDDMSSEITAIPQTKIYRITGDSIITVKCKEKVRRNIADDFLQWETAACTRNVLYAALLRSVIQTFQSVEHLRGSKGVLIQGDPGSGKTTFVQDLCKTCPFSTVYWLESHELYKGGVGETEIGLRRLLRHAFGACDQGRQVFIVLENVANICPVNPRSALERRTMRCIYSAMKAAVVKDLPIWFIGITSDTTQIDPAAISSGIFGYSFTLPMLTASQRQIFLSLLLAKANVSSVEALSTRFAERTHGCSLSDLEGCCGDAVLKWSSSAAESSLQEVLEEAFAVSRPSLLRDTLGRPPQPTIPWEYYSKLCAAARDVLKNVVLSVSQAPLFTGIGLRPPRGLLLHGEAGTGKSELAHSVLHHVLMAGHANVLFIHSPDIVSALVGSSEATLSSLFARARDLSPCVLVFDNVEVLAPARMLNAQGSIANHAFDRLLSVFLTEMDGISTTRDSAASPQHVFIFAITRDRTLLDDALLRPGRLDVHIELRYPDAETREAILAYYFAKSGLQRDGIVLHEDGTSESWSGVLHRMACESDGWSPAALRAVWQRAALSAMRCAMDIAPVADEDTVRILCEHVTAAFKEVAHAFVH